MLNLSIMPLDVNHVDEICLDIENQQKQGVSSHALFFMTFAPPEGIPPVNKAEIFCKKYDIFREKLDKVNAKHGVLVQATMGHLVKPNEKHPFQTVISLVDGSERPSTCCPLDIGFKKYAKEQMRILATHKPSIIMIDDVGMLYRVQKGCACPLHMAEFNKRAKTNMTREELYAHTQGTSQENKYYTDLYVQVQADALEDFVKAMREGIDMVDPTIQGAVSGIHDGFFCEFSDRTAKAFCGKNNPKIVRANNGCYTVGGGRWFSTYAYRVAIIKEYLKDNVDIILSEGDSCPHNRYATSASLLHAQTTGAILEGASGIKLWITRLIANEPNSGKEYRKYFSKYHKFYDKLCEYYKQLTPFGCRIPLPTMQNYMFVKPAEKPSILPWSTSALEVMGLPLYFSNEKGGAVFLDEHLVDRLTDSEIKNYFNGTVVLSALACKKLNERGFNEYIGATVDELEDKAINYDNIDGHLVQVPVDIKLLTPNKQGVEILSKAVRMLPNRELEEVCPTITGYINQLGGYTVVYAGTPITRWHYTTSFALLNESRKNQFIKILNKQNNLPIYYTEDNEVYLRAGYLDNGEIMCAVFNLGIDPLEDIPLYTKYKVTKVEKLNSDGSRSACSFNYSDNILRVNEPSYMLAPTILFIS